MSGIEDDLNFDEEEFMAELEEIDDKIFDTIEPLIQQIQAEHPEHNIWFVLYTHALYELLNSGATREELIGEIDTQIEMFSDPDFITAGSDMLH
jgi:hypothetical protein